ncbi:MAG: prepilin-type N-terminal cleavage/methylation domain-containing protein [Planctomycetaceae bacterium]|nr:prepilin-type N-terminal cleavage/methylation domain-containing protein [Planctomycetaceae bacterium]
MRLRLFGFTLIELMVVIFIIAILAGVAIPLMKIRLDRSKWTEANAAAGLIRNAVKTTYFQNNTAISGSMDDPENQAALSITATDLTGTYFVPGDYQIVSVNDDGMAVITVTGSLSNAPEGSRTLALDGSWE